MGAARRDLEVLRRVKDEKAGDRKRSLTGTEQQSKKVVDDVALETANFLKSFVNKQRNRLAGKTAKHEWLIGWQKLVEEESKIVRALERDCKYALASAPLSSGIAITEERYALHGERRLLSAMVSSVSDGDAPEGVLAEVQVELQASSASSTERCCALKEEEDMLSTALREAWPSTVPGPDNTDPAGCALAEREAVEEELMKLLEDFPKAATIMGREVHASVEEVDTRRDERLARIEEREAEIRREASHSSWDSALQTDGRCTKPRSGSQKSQKRTVDMKPKPSKGARLVALRSAGSSSRLTSCIAHPHDSSAAAAAAWLGARRRLAASRRAAAAAWREERKVLASHIRKLLSTTERRIRDAEETASESARRQERQRELRATLDEAIARRDVEDELERIRQEDAVAAALAEEAMRKEIWRMEQESRRELVAEFQRQRKAMQAAEEVRRQEEEEKERELISKRAGPNAERVTFRRGLLEERARQRKREEEAMREEAAAREERLAAIRAEICIHASADPNRILEPTQSVLNQRDAAKEDELFPVHGYSTDTLMRDERFKLSLRLREAGLHTSAYAMTALNSVKTATVPRRDAMSSNQLAVMASPSSFPK